MKITAFWNVALHRLVEVDQCFRGAYYLHHQGSLITLMKHRPTSKNLHGALSQKAVTACSYVVKPIYRSVDPAYKNASYLHEMLMCHGCISVVPSIAPFSFGEKAVNAGQIVQQNCIVLTGDDPLSISWTFNGADASSSAGIYVLKIGSRTSILTIESVRSYHGGNYTCMAVNSAGSASFTAHLAVNGTSLTSFSYCCL
jgi:hypothetical protein